METRSVPSSVEGPPFLGQMEKYKAKTVEDLTKIVVVMAKSVHTPGLPAELRNLLSLLKIQKLRHSADAHAFCKCGGMQALVQLLQFCEADSRDCITVLGTIGNLCALNQESRSSVRKRCYCLPWF